MSRTRSALFHNESYCRDSTTLRFLGLLPAETFGQYGGHEISSLTCVLIMLCANRATIDDKLEAASVIPKVRKDLRLSHEHAKPVSCRVSP